MTEVLVDPTDRCRGLIVVADVTHELASEILYGGEDTSRNNVALNLGKPNLDLIEPAGIGRGVMDANGRISLKEFKNFLGFGHSSYRQSRGFRDLLVDYLRSAQGSR